MARLSDGRGSASLSTVVAVFAAGALVGALAAVEVVPASRVPVAASSSNGETILQNNQPNAPGATRGPNAPNATAGPNNTKAGPVVGQQQQPNGPGVAPSKYQCRPGANGGATDRGVTGNKINLATTIVASGLGSSFLGEMKYAMEAVIEQVNRAGGICGRILTLQTRDDRWDRTLGAQYLRNYIDDKGIFAIPVGASSEGLASVIDGGDLDRAHFPAVGTDGLAVRQYAAQNGNAQQWVWPIATATVSSARIMAADAVKRGAKHPGIVFDKDYKFGSEAAAAFNKEVKRLTGNEVPGAGSATCTQLYCGLTAGQNSYSTEVAKFYGSKPDYVALFLEPDTALTWMADSNTPGANSGTIAYGYGGAQPLFTNQFEVACRAKCDQMVVWSGFKPNTEKYASDPAVVSYVRALRAKNPQADPYNQFTESAYVGMQFFVEALKLVGPELTRDRLKAVMDSMSSYSNPLTLQGMLSFSPSSRFANTTMQAFTMQYKGTAAGWRLGVVAKDPDPRA